MDVGRSGEGGAEGWAACARRAGESGEGDGGRYSRSSHRNEGGMMEHEHEKQAEPEGDARKREHYKALGGDVPTIGGGANMAGSGPSRISARHVIEQRIYQLQAEAHDLQTLLRALPQEMPAAAESALWTIVTRGGSR